MCTQKHVVFTFCLRLSVAISVVAFRNNTRWDPSAPPLRAAGSADEAQSRSPFAQAVRRQADKSRLWQRMTNMQRSAAEM